MAHLSPRHLDANHFRSRHLDPSQPIGSGAGHFAARHFQANFYHSRHWDAETAAEETESVSGGWLSPEQARAVLRKIHRKRAEKAKRVEELTNAINEAKQAELNGASPSEAISPVLEIVERDTGLLMLPMLASLEDALSQLGMIDQQIAALNQRRMDDAAAVLLLMDI